MRKFIFIMLGLIVFLILAAAIIPFLIPGSVYKSAIEGELSDRLNREVVISSDVKVSPFPVLKVKAGDVTIANEAGFTADYLAKMDSLDVRVKLLPLISKRVEIAAFELVGPKISLEKNADGKANWMIGSAPTSETDAGPFKRDGRFADLNASIGKFSISDGQVQYQDNQSGKSHTLDQVNLSFGLSDLASPLTTSGELRINTVPVEMDVTLDSPRKFLDGQKTPVDFDIKSDLGNIKAKGYFTESADPHFVLDLKGSVQDFGPLAGYAPPDFKILDILKSMDFSGNYSFDGKSFLAKGADITLNGPLLKSTFKGDAGFSDMLRADGDLDLSVSDLKNVLTALDIKNDLADMISNVDVKGGFKMIGDDLTSENLTAKLIGNGLEATFDGKGKFGDNRAVSGRFSTNIDSIPQLAARFGFTQPTLKPLGKGNVSGLLDYDGTTTRLELDKARTEGQDLVADYTGSVILADGTTTLNGTFDSQIPSLSNFGIITGMPIPYSQAIGRADAKGSISGSLDNLDLSALDINIADGELTGNYQGSANMTTGTGLRLDGNFSGHVSKLAQLASAAGVEIPYAQTIGMIDADGRVKGMSDNLDLSDLSIRLQNGQLNGQFTGAALLNNGVNLNGNLNAEVPSVRVLTQSTSGVDLPPSTDSGQIYERVSMVGNVTGTPDQIKFSGADLSLDKLMGKGDFTLDISQSRPTLKGQMNMEQIDLRPYLDAYSAPNAGKGVQPWSEVPYNFSALRVMDGNYIVKTPEIIVGPLTFGQTDLNTEVTNGIMTARLPKVNLYGGLGVMTATLDASGDIPKIKLAVTLEDIKSNRFLASVASFTQLEGDGHTLLELTGEGRTQGEIMRSLNGYGDFKVLGGNINGIDLSKFLTGIDQSLTQRVLPQGIGSKYATKFNDMVGKFKVRNGVISIDSFNMQAFDVLASGAGKLDIGNQSVDFSLRPRLTGTDVSDIGRFGIPLRFKGNWGSISTGPDFDLLQNIAIEKAKLKAKKELTNQVGGQLGGVIGGILGVPNEPAQPVTGANTETPAPDAPTPSEEPQSDGDILGSVLGQIVGTNQDSSTSSEQASQNGEAGTNNEEPKEKKLEEKLLDEALGGLFGGKKDGGN